ncbi:hypothetical protein D9M71_287790 [compost metagenome]
MQLAALEPLFGIETILFGQAAVVGRHCVAPQAFAQVARQPFSQASGVDENQRGAVLAGQLCQALIHQFPGIGRHHGAQWHLWYFDTQVTRPGMADVDDAAGPADAHQQMRDLFDGLLRGRQADTAQRRRAQCLQPFQAQGQVAATLACGDGVDFVDDDGVRTAKHAPAGIRAEQHVQRLGCGHQDMRGTLAHGRAFFLQGIAGAHRGADFQQRESLPIKFGSNAGQGRLQIDLDIVGQRLEWRHVHDQGLVG